MWSLVQTNKQTTKKQDCTLYSRLKWYLLFYNAGGLDYTGKTQKPTKNYWSDYDEVSSGYHAAIVPLHSVVLHNPGPNTCKCQYWPSQDIGVNMPAFCTGYYTGGQSTCSIGSVE